jgi:hypothetical protein
MRGITRFIPGTKRHGGAIPKLVIWPDDTTPVYETFFWRPTSAPSGTMAAGSGYFDATRNAPMFSDGTVFVPAGGAGIVKTAAATLTAADHGAYCFFNSAAGDIYTLPTARAGLRFHFVVLVTITSNAAKIITASASEFLLGGFEQSTDGTYTTAVHAANGSTIRAWSGNGGTTGGLAQDWFTVVGLSATQWAIWGHGRATGAEATPFATS